MRRWETLAATYCPVVVAAAEAEVVVVVGAATSGATGIARKALIANVAVITPGEEPVPPEPVANVPSPPPESKTQ